MSDIRFTNKATPTSPPTGTIKVFSDSTGRLKYVNSAGALKSLIARTMLAGGVAPVGASGLKQMSIGGSTAASTMAFPGRVVAISVALTAPRTAGTITVGTFLNGVAQTGAGQIITIDAVTTQNAFLSISPFVEFVAGNTVTGGLLPSGFAPATANATIVLYLEND